MIVDDKMAMKPRTGWFAFDTESGGLENEFHSLLTLSGIVVDDNLKPLALPINLKIKHDVYRVTAKALEINKINLVEHDKVATTIEASGNELYKYLLPFIENGRLGIIGQNVEFDKGFVLKSGLIRIWDRFFNRDVLDTKEIASHLKTCEMIPKEVGNSLVQLANHFNIDSTGAHEAEKDLWMTLQVLNELRMITKKGINK